jgi:hypothetical protein
MAHYFFDTSAQVKHYLVETGTDAVDRFIDEPGAELLIARLTLVETMSVFATKVRTGEFTSFAPTKGSVRLRCWRAWLSSIQSSLNAHLRRQ